MRLRILAALVASVLPLGLGASAEPAVFPPGARIGLVAPAGFVPAGSFVGFEDKAFGGAIVIADLPVATFAEMLPTFTPDGMARGGIRATEPASPWPIPDGEGRILRGGQDSRGVTYRRWLVLARTRDTAALVSAMVPEAAADAAAPRIEAALKTIAFRPPPSLDEQIAALPFGVGDPAGFRPVLATGGLSLLLTEGPSEKPQAATQPLVYLIIHVSGAQGGPEANAALAGQLFRTTPTLRNIEPIRSDDRGGTSRIEGTAIEGATKTEVEVFQIIRFESGGYMRAVGVWRREDASRYRERFERLVLSIAAR